MDTPHPLRRKGKGWGKEKANVTDDCQGAALCRCRADDPRPHEDEAAPHAMRIRSENGTDQSREVTIISESGLSHALIRSR
jgi:hypothetical protein